MDEAKGDPEYFEPRPLTYKQFMTEPMCKRRFDVIRGMRCFLPSSIRHQDMAGNLLRAVGAWEDKKREGVMMFAPMTVLIAREPLHMRQPDVLFLSRERWAQYWPEWEMHSMHPAPELVFEVQDSWETEAYLREKIADFQSVDVRECWLIRPEMETVEVLKLTANSADSVATYGADETVASFTFPGLNVKLQEIFE